ncbi:MAG: BamA/TamA family outer membrane protein [Deltaproteobacteria bacterium]|jgi:translocation and assembly module TamA|nr:BamA/TamA family outer membrane protein [Deltaproteobacteria bacterium]
MALLARWLCLILVIILATTACGRISEEFPTLSRENQTAPTEDLVKSDPQGPIPHPNLPASPSTPVTPEIVSNPEEKIKYKTQIIPTDIWTTPELKEIPQIFQETAELYVLADKPVLSPMTLTRRLRASLEKGHDILKSKGYYEGEVTGWMEIKEDSPETVVVIKFNLGELYHLGTSQVIARLESPPENSPENSTKALDGSKPADNKENPRPQLQVPQPQGSWPSQDLKEAGWVSGQPALADQVLAIVERNVAIWTAKGYPKVKTVATSYFLDPEKKLLNAEVTMEPGYFALMGPLVLKSEGDVKNEYVQNLVNWKVGQVWHQPSVDRFVESMFQTGLFKSVEPSVGEEDESGHRPVVIEASSTMFRSISGSINYDSDFGPGVAVTWEHRNLTGWGDRLRLEAPVWTDLYQLGASYIRPYFFSPKQSFLMDLSLIHEKADTYTLSAISTAVGLERRLSRHLTGLIQVSLEAGYLEEEIKPKTKYTIYGLPLALDWDYSDDLLNPTKGTRLKLSLRPYMGDYFDQFKIIKSRLDASHYFPIMRDGRLVFAIRGAAGGIWGADRTKLPATLRFYGGGGGSMRGYEYQSVGPRNELNKPDGGGAMAEVSGEIRWRWSETMGATAFVDGGMVYDKPEISKIGQSFLWGGGLGFRYYTPIGPFRLDLATPLTPRPEDSALQIYLSLGQSF